MFLARCAKRSVLSVSERQPAAGLTLAIMMVFELPPSESYAVPACVSRCLLLRSAPPGSLSVSHACSQSLPLDMLRFCSKTNSTLASFLTAARVTC